MIAADVLVNGDDESSIQTIWYQCWKYSSIPTCIIHMRAGHAYMHSKSHVNIQDGAGQVTAAVQNAKKQRERMAWEIWTNAEYNWYNMIIKNNNSKKEGRERNEYLMKDKY